MHAVMPVTKGGRYSIAICSPRRLHALQSEDWVKLDTLGYLVSTLTRTHQPTGPTRRHPFTIMPRDTISASS
eukprot:5187004-Amphidinium_carterae.1